MAITCKLFGHKAHIGAVEVADCHARLVCPRCGHGELVKTKAGKWRVWSSDYFRESLNIGFARSVGGK